MFANLCSSRSLFPRELPNAETQPEGMPRTRTNLQVSFCSCADAGMSQTWGEHGALRKANCIPPLGSS